MKKEATLRSILFACIIVLVASLAAKYHFRIDLTRNKMYTVSEYTKECLADLDASVSITWYRSPELSRIFPSVSIIEDILEEYRVAASGRLSWKTLKTKSTDQQMLQSLGIVSRQIDIKATDGSLSGNVYSGLVLEYKTGKRTIPFLSDTTNLEYDLTRMILELVSQNGTNMPANRMQLVYGTTSSADRYGYVVPWLEYAGFSVETKSIPVTSLDASAGLLVIGSQSIDALTASAIEAFLNAGGNASFFVSGTTVNIAGNWSAQTKNQDLLLQLLQRHGVSIQRELLLDTSNFRITMPALDKSNYEYINYPFWITVPLSGKKDILLSGIDALQFFWPSPVLIADPAVKNFHTVASTGKDAIVMMEPYNTDPFGKQLALFASKSGAVRNICVAGEGQNRIVVIADEYLPSTMIEYTASDQNLDFMVNCAEWISGKDRLIDLKNKTIQTPTGVDVSEPQLRLSRMINLLGIPALVIVVALTVMFLRRKRR